MRIVKQIFDHFEDVRRNSYDGNSQCGSCDFNSADWYS